MYWLKGRLSGVINEVPKFQGKLAACANHQQHNGLLIEAPIVASSLGRSASPVRKFLAFQCVRILPLCADYSVAGKHYHHRLSKAHLNRSLLHNCCVGGSTLMPIAYGHAGSDGSDEERNGPKSRKNG